MSCAKPVNRRGERGITACLVGGCCNPLRTPRAALNSDNNLPRMANSIINKCGSKNNKIISFQNDLGIYNLIFLPCSTQAPSNVTTFE